MRVRRNLLYLGALLLVPLSTFAAFNLTPFRIEGGWGFLFLLTILTVAGLFTLTGIGLCPGIDILLREIESVLAATSGNTFGLAGFQEPAERSRELQVLHRLSSFPFLVQPLTHTICFSVWTISTRSLCAAITSSIGL